MPCTYMCLSQIVYPLAQQKESRDLRVQNEARFDIV